MTADRSVAAAALALLLLLLALSVAAAPPATAQEEEEAGQDEVVDDAQDPEEEVFEDADGATGEGAEPGLDAEEPGFQDDFDEFEDFDQADPEEGLLSPMVLFLISLGLIVVVAVLVFFSQVSRGKGADRYEEVAR